MDVDKLVSHDHDHPADGKKNAGKFVSFRFQKLSDVVSLLFECFLLIIIQRKHPRY